jgi:hypothetical protein
MSGEKNPSGLLSVVDAFQMFQTNKRGAGWGRDYPLPPEGITDRTPQEQWQDERQREMKEDESEFMDAVLSSKFEVLVREPDGEYFTITPNHIAESALPPSSIITNEIWTFPGDTLEPYAGRTPFVRRSEFLAWLDQMSGRTLKRMKPGPKKKLDEAKFQREVLEYVKENGMPDPTIDPNSRQSDLERHMMNWHNEAVSESTNRTYVNRAIEAIKANWRK